MNFNKRLRLYMFGFIFGCLFVLFIYNRKESEFNYLPNDRVIGDFKKKNIYFDTSFYGLDTIKLLNNFVKSWDSKIKLRAPHFPY